jgi:hypothetical protein
MKGNLEYLYIAVGDLVRAEFTCSTETRIIRVTEVERRYGKTCKGTRTPNPLVIGINVDTNKEVVFDASFVEEILERPESKIVHPKKNVFRESSGAFHVTKKGGRWTGTLRALAIEALAELPYEFDRFLDESQLVELYSRSGIGCKNWDYPFLTVDKHRFCRWVSRNYTRIVYTSKKQNDYITSENKHIDEMLEADLDRMDREECEEEDREYDHQMRF